MIQRALPAVLAATLCLSLPVQAATYDLSIFHTERDVFAEQYKWWAEEVARRTQGRVAFKAHFGGALTTLSDTFNAVRNGVIPAGLTAPSVISGQMPAMGYMEALGGMPSDWTKAKEAGEKLQPVLETMFRAQGVEYVWMQPSFGTGVACSGKHLKQAGDWKGVKVRSAGRWQSAQVQQLGASPTSIDVGEMYLALQNRTVDCALIVMNLALSLKLHEVAPKITHLNVPVNAALYIVNKDVWAKFSDADKKVVKEVGREAQSRAMKSVFEGQEAAAAKLKELGADFHLLNAEEQAGFRAAMRPVFTRIGEGAGAAGKPIEEVLRPFW